MSGTKYQPDYELYQLTMAAIRAGKRTDGSISNTAPIRLIREGAQVYQESQTFARKQAAQAWVRSVKPRRINPARSSGQAAKAPRLRSD